MPASQDFQAVAGYMVSSDPAAASWETADEARVRIVDGQHYEDASNVFVLSAGSRPPGVVAIRDMLSASPFILVMALARDIDSRCVTLDTNRIDAASLAIHSGLSILPVCDAEGRMLGAVPARAPMTMLRDEHLEDLHHMAGVPSQSDTTRNALALCNRLPGHVLVVGLFRCRDGPCLLNFDG